jgi:ABC-type multidrug transport system permease subunit
MYHLSSYYLGKQLAELPLQVIVPAAFATVIYWTVGLPSEWYIYGTFLSLVMLMACCVSSAGLLLGALFPLQAALVVLPCLLLVSLLFAGFYVNPDNIPVWVDWVKYISLFFYAYEAVIQNQFSNLPLYCKKDQFVTLSATAKCSSGELVTVSSVTCPITNGDAIVKLVGGDLLEMWQYQLILLGFVLFVRVLLYPALKFARPVEVS